MLPVGNNDEGSGSYPNFTLHSHCQQKCTPGVGKTQLNYLKVRSYNTASSLLKGWHSNIED